MPTITVDGRSLEVPEGRSVLWALQTAGIVIPHVCHDDRLKPAAVCRTCLVEVDGQERPLPSCSTPVHHGMVLRTTTPRLDAERHEILAMLAARHPPGSAEGTPEKEFHGVLAAHGLLGEQRAPSRPELVDDSHPYIAVDMNRCIACWRCVRICDELQGQHTWHVWDRGAHAHVVPDQGARFGMSTCVSCGACADSCPTDALLDRSRAERGRAAEWTRTTCPYCGVGCEQWVGTRDGRIVGIRPVLEAPVSKGHLCSKGRYAWKFLEAPDRPTAPMLKVDGRWREASWDEAIRHVASELSRLLREKGPSAIGVLGSARAPNEDNYVAQKLARVVLGTNNVDCCARVCHAPSAAALAMVLGTGAATSSFDDVERARTILLAGSNATENHPIVGARMRQAVLKGATLVVVDPRRIELAQLAAFHLQLHPGTNVPLFHALCRVVLTEGLADDAFVSARTEGLDELRAAVEPWTPERAGEVCGVPAGDIREVARLVARARPAISFHGLGLTEQVQGTDSVACLANLMLLTGNVGLPGTGVNPLRGQNNVQGSAHMGCEPSRLAGYQPLADAAPKAEAVWGAKIPREPGLDLLQMMDAAEEGRLSALWAIGYDVLLTNPDMNRTRRALGGLEMLVVQDPFWNETAREFGTVFLPVAVSFERDGTFMNGERRVQRVRRAVPPPAGVKEDWQILCEVAAAMGHAERFAFRSPAEIWEEVRKVWAPGAGISYARLESGGLQWPCPTEDHPGTSLLHQQRFTRGDRAKLHAAQYRPSAEEPSPELPFLLVTGRTLHQFNAGTMTMRTDHVKLRPADTLDISPADAARLGLADGDRVRIASRHGEAVLPARIQAGIRPGELFATFHTARAQVNLVTGPGRDARTHTPEYKRTAVRLERAGG